MHTRRAFVWRGKSVWCQRPHDFTASFALPSYFKQRRLLPMLDRYQGTSLLGIDPIQTGSVMLQVFEAAPQDVRGVPAKKAAPDYFL